MLSAVLKCDVQLVSFVEVEFNFLSLFPKKKQLHSMHIAYKFNNFIKINKQLVQLKYFPAAVILFLRGEHSHIRTRKPLKLN